MSSLLIRWILLIVLASYLNIACTESKRLDYAKTPILFVHGHGLYAGDWDPLIAYLKKQGYPDSYLYAVTISPNRMANKAAAEKVIQPAVEKLLQGAVRAAKQNKQSAPQKIDIVAHSMGAMSSRWYTARIAPERVRTWIGIAPANHGSNALCKHSDDGAKDLCPAFAKTIEESEIQVELNGMPQSAKDETPFGVGKDPKGKNSIAADGERNILYITIRIEPDEWIVPADSALLSGAGGVALSTPKNFVETLPGNYKFAKPSGHMSLLTNKALMRLVLAVTSARDQ